MGYGTNAAITSLKETVEAAQTAEAEAAQSYESSSDYQSAYDKFKSYYSSQVTAMNILNKYL